VDLESGEAFGSPDDASSDGESEGTGGDDDDDAEEDGGGEEQYAASDRGLCLIFQ